MQINSFSVSNLTNWTHFPQCFRCLTNVCNVNFQTQIIWYHCIGHSLHYPWTGWSSKCPLHITLPNWLSLFLVSLFKIPLSRIFSRFPPNFWRVRVGHALLYGDHQAREGKSGPLTPGYECPARSLADNDPAVHLSVCLLATYHQSLWPLTDNCPQTYIFQVSLFFWSCFEFSCNLALYHHASKPRKFKWFCD